jgi:hypothetical protein
MKKCEDGSNTRPIPVTTPSTTQDVDQETINNYLDDLRDSGVVNMFGAAPYLERKFDLSAEEAQSKLASWMESF